MFSGAYLPVFPPVPNAWLSVPTKKNNFLPMEFPLPGLIPISSQPHYPESNDHVSRKSPYRDIDANVVPTIPQTRHPNGSSVHPITKYPVPATTNDTRRPDGVLPRKGTSLPHPVPDNARHPLPSPTSGQSPTHHDAQLIPSTPPDESSTYPSPHHSSVQQTSCSPPRTLSTSPSPSGHPPARPLSRSWNHLIEVPEANSR